MTPIKPDINADKYKDKKTVFSKRDSYLSKSDISELNSIDFDYLEFDVEDGFLAIKIGEFVQRWYDIDLEKYNRLLKKTEEEEMRRYLQSKALYEKHRGKYGE